MMAGSSTMDSNVIECALNQGLHFFLRIHRPEGNNIIKGAGVASVHMEGDNPKSERDIESLWTKEEPCFGDVSIADDSRGGMYMHLARDHSKVIEELIRRTYLCRAPVNQAFDINAYSYWYQDTQSWSPQRLTTHRKMCTAKITYEHASFPYPARDPSTPFCSNYFNKWMVLYCGSWGYSDVYVMTAGKLERPWDKRGDVVVASTQPEGGAPVAGEFR